MGELERTGGLTLLVLAVALTLALALALAASPSPSPSPNPNPNPNPKAVTPITGGQWLSARQMGARGSDVSLVTVDETTFLVSRSGGHEEL
eukprot:scaffold132011_cov54-Phaeocystis_antarctica.AAC.2